MDTLQYMKLNGKHFQEGIKPDYSYGYKKLKGRQPGQAKWKECEACGTAYQPDGKECPYCGVRGE